MQVVVVYSQKTKNLMPFTLGSCGEIIPTGNREYDLDDLRVSLVEVDTIIGLDNRYFVVLQGDKHGRNPGETGKEIRQEHLRREREE